MKWPSLAAHSRASLAEALATVTPALTLRLDGSRAAANTIIRKRAVLHGALSYAAETGVLPDNPLDSFVWRVPQSSAALDPAVVASPAQVGALLDVIARTQPELTAFFGCLYYAALRPEEAVALRLADCDLPSSGWGVLRLAAATPRTAAAWTSSGTSHEQRGLKHRPDGTIRMAGAAGPAAAAPSPRPPPARRPAPPPPPARPRRPAPAARTRTGSRTRPAAGQRA